VRSALKFTTTIEAPVLLMVVQIPRSRGRSSGPFVRFQSWQPKETGPIGARP